MLYALYSIGSQFESGDIRQSETLSRSEGFLRFRGGKCNNEFTSDAWVFFDLLRKAASEFQLNTSLVLGNIIAHELGHLLLGANAHSKWGLMRARWTREDLVAADRGELSFSNLERDRIHIAVIARYQAQGPLKGERVALQ